MSYIPQIPQRKRGQWQHSCNGKKKNTQFVILHFSLHSVCVHTSSADTLNPNLAGLPQSKQGDCVFVAALVFPFSNWLMMICCGWETSVFFPPLSVEWLMLCFSCSRTWSSSLMTVSSRGWTSAPPDVSTCWSSRPDPRDCSSGCRWEEDFLFRERRNGD